MEKEKTIKRKNSAITKIVIGILSILLIVAIITGGFQFNKEGDVVKENDSPDTPSIANMNSIIENDAIKGDVNAPVTMVEFSDYECPYCERFYSETFSQIEEEYIDTGKVKFVYRDFPLNFHPNAQKAAEAAECAGEQGKYYEMHDKLFEDGVKGGVNSFKQYALDMGLNIEEFNTCLDSGKMASEIAKDMSDGQKLGIKGTPGFIINGKLVSGAQPFSVFQKIIEQELN